MGDEKEIVFIHPDLGIGGAERLIVDAALALKSKGHRVHIITSHHDPKHCFPETKDGTIDVISVGDWLPRSLFGYCYALCAFLRILYASIFLICFSNIKFDIVFCDQVSISIPILKIKSKKVIFYCHFPDQLLTERNNFFKWLYRLPLDYIEEKTTGMADVILVNSCFTAEVFKKTFQSLQHTKLEVVYPPINVEACRQPLPDAEIGVKTQANTIFLSINRYERKKNISLAVLAMKHLQKTLSAAIFSKIHLIIAGGYDERVLENKYYHLELLKMVEELGLKENISFLKSPCDKQKRVLFHCCTAVLYTPENEHFGIVPIEAMLFGRPVLACNSGGPRETVLHEQTGYLCEPTPEAFAEKMNLLTQDHSLARELGVVGTDHVSKNFSFKKFANHLNAFLE